MARQVYCNNCEQMSYTKPAGSFLITIMLLFLGFIPGVIYEIWRRSSKRCGVCGSSSIMPINSPAAQQAMRRQQETQEREALTRELHELKARYTPESEPIAEPPPPIPEPELPPKETYAIEKNINGGLIEFFGLSKWYQAVFTDEQRHRLEERFGTENGNRLANGAVKFKFANTDKLQFLYDLENKLKPKAYSDLYALVDEQFKIEAGNFCKIDDERWENEKYYKSWFALMKNRIDALNKLNKDNYFTKGQFEATKDKYATAPCLELSNKGFDIIGGELDRAFDTHFAEPIEGCRCIVRGYRG